jgi:hypothetical protein
MCEENYRLGEACVVSFYLQNRFYLVFPGSSHHSYHSHQSSSLDSAFSLNHHDMMLVIFFLLSLLFFFSPLWFLVWFFILYNLYVSFFCLNFNPYILAYRNNRTFCKNDVWIYSAIESEATKNAVVNCLTKVFVKNDVWKRGCIKFVTIEKQSNFETGSLFSKLHGKDWV